MSKVRDELRTLTSGRVCSGHLNEKGRCAELGCEGICGEVGVWGEETAGKWGGREEEREEGEEGEGEDVGTWMGAEAAIADCDCGALLFPPEEESKLLLFHAGFSSFGNHVA